MAGIVAVVVALSVINAFSPTSGQIPAALPRVGMLAPVPSAAAKPLSDAFREAMRELGYVEGKNVVYEHRSAEGQLDRLPQLAAELVKIPVKVMVAVGDPVRVGLVSKLGRPGGNITGFTSLTGQITATRIGAIGNPGSPTTKLEPGVNMKTAAALNIKIPQAILVQADQVIE